MRWKFKNWIDHDERVVKRFLWRPVALVKDGQYSYADKQWRWLEWAYIRQ